MPAVPRLQPCLASRSLLQAGPLATIPCSAHDLTAVPGHLPQALRDLERQGGVAALEALVACKLREDVSTGAAAARPDVEYIWA